MGLEGPSQKIGDSAKMTNGPDLEAEAKDRQQRMKERTIRCLVLSRELQTNNSYEYLVNIREAILNQAYNLGLEDTLGNKIREKYKEMLSGEQDIVKAEELRGYLIDTLHEIIKV